MARKKVKELVQEKAGQYLAENGYELHNVAFVKEGKDWFLRITIDFADWDDSRYIGTEDCERVSRFLSDMLDQEDPIEQNYYLEVSSPGLDRELLTEKDYQRFAGKEVEVRLYQALPDGKKTFTGLLQGMREGNIVVAINEGKELKLSPEQIAKASLTVTF